MICPSQFIFITLTIKSYSTAAFLRFLPTKSLGLLVNHNRLTICIFRVSCLNSNTKCITSVRVEAAIFLKAHKGERANTKGNIVNSKSIILKTLINTSATLRSNTVTIDSFNVRIKDPITLAIDGSTENIPQTPDSSLILRSKLIVFSQLNIIAFNVPIFAIGPSAALISPFDCNVSESIFSIVRENLLSILIQVPLKELSNELTWVIF